ncbi:TPA: DUF3310 domain-containing protein [Streptococcus suis]|uniref:DUF3310 domain-containing protein n=1 Tax=Streptococcus suis TaxID=1307 RepID=UPI0014782DC0|nr:DUF3310 domain-containing protein [Streptococcus suis]HEL1642968.1 DUF3310 domain-containing protein [Streptococcus suis]HEL1658478.1 DUF3310 domain-containing protein [Streptococcus suis]HEL1673693.1 DUF3310 domain-containing protein [Streptococcus suis]HEL1773753.1 DUF3310 domain-containing protein [Streptococcus suis]
MIYACTCPECEGQEEQFNNVTKPKHYQGKYGLEVIDVTRNFIGNLRGMQAVYFFNTVKYILRFQWKNGVEDLKKARQHLDWLIEEMEEVE